MRKTHSPEEKTKLVKEAPRGASTMKILHVIAQLPARTGSGVYFNALINEMKKFGHKQRAVFAVQDNYSFDDLECFEPHPVSFKSRELPFPIVGMSDVMPYESTVYSKMNDEMILLWRTAFEKVLYKAKTEFDPDIVVLHHLWMLTSIAAEIFNGKAKLIGVCHNTDIRQAEQHPQLKDKYVINLHRLDRVFSLSDGQSQKISDTFGIAPEKITTIAGGFNQELFYPPCDKNKNDKVQIVYSAKIVKSKGVYELITAFRRLNKPNTHLDIIGVPDKDNAKLLEYYIADASNITLVPIKNQRELAAYIREKDIFVMPSYFEGLGLMAIECLACGLRVVATEIEALMALLGEKVNNSGLIEYVPLPRIYDTDKPYEEDIEKFIANLSDKLLMQIKRVETGEKLSEDIFTEINKHSWSGVAQRIDEEITKLLSAPETHPLT